MAHALLVVAAILQAIAVAYGLLLVDMGMPFEDGHSLVRRVRRLPPDAAGSTPAISLTAHARNEDRARALAAGFDDHLPKPVDVAALLKAVRACTLRSPRSAIPA